MTTDLLLPGLQWLDLSINLSTTSSLNRFNNEGSYID